MEDDELSSKHGDIDEDDDVDFDKKSATSATRSMYYENHGILLYKVCF